MDEPPAGMVTQDNSAALFESAELKLQPTRTCEIAYRRFGEGPPLIFLHGWPLTSFTFRRLLPYLVPHFTCYLIDVPGGGETRWTKHTDFSWPGQAKTIKELIDALTLPTYFLFGQDSGGMIARSLAMIDDGRLRKLIMTNTEMPGHRPPWIRLYRISMFIPGTNLVMRLLLRSRRFLHSRFGFGKSFFNLALLDEAFHAHVVAPLIHSHRRMVGHNQFLRGWDWGLLDQMKMDVHTKIQVPVLLIWGEDDPTFPVEHAEHMVSQFPNATIRRIAGARVFVHEDQPAEVSRLVIKFLNS
jgi:pimeloyl-ACP methyl ester carboxylesterase